MSCVSPSDLNESYSNAQVLQCLQVRFDDAFVRNHVMDRLGGRDVRKTAVSELAGVADSHHTAGPLHHDAVDFRFEQIGRAQTKLYIEAIHTEKASIAAHLSETLLRHPPNQQKRIPSHPAP